MTIICQAKCLWRNLDSLKHISISLHVEASIQHLLPGVCCFGRLFNKCGRPDHWLQLAETLSIFFCWLEFDKNWQGASPPCQQMWFMVLRGTMLGPFGLLLVYSIDVLTSRRFAIHKSNLIFVSKIWICCNKICNQQNLSFSFTLFLLRQCSAKSKWDACDDHL